MGYERNHAIIVTGWQSEFIEEAHKLAEGLFLPSAIEMSPSKHGHVNDHPIGMVTPILCSPVNGRYSFAILPDGSKEGWDTSKNADAARKKFVDWLRKEKVADRCCDWVEVMYGDENQHLEILSSNDMEEEP